MKYAHLEKDTNKLLGWYSNDIHSEIPTPSIEVSEQVWQEAININANCYEDGKFVVKDFRTETEIKIYELDIKIQEAKNYLASTDYYMNVDKYATLTTERQVELTTKRAEARELINTLEAELLLQGVK